ncbi:hypothetical protein [Geothrix limicola]|uniref:hypothetical protein n=1 Tax=Geothrix limicola TaxID=2927978 RepID=UPI0025576BBE|nr:hypothetical protein [Geothrix limicola]
MNKHPARPARFIAIPIVLCTMVGCSKGHPDETREINIKDAGVIFIIETFYGLAAMDSDITNVYVSTNPRIQSDRKLVLHGQNLTVADIKQVSKTSFTIFIRGGLITQFTPHITTTNNGSTALIDFKVQELK